MARDACTDEWPKRHPNDGDAKSLQRPLAFRAKRAYLSVEYVGGGKCCVVRIEEYLPAAAQADNPDRVIRSEAACAHAAFADHEGRVRSPGDAVSQEAR